MRYLKSYKLFESVITKSEYPTELDIKELFYDLTDEESLSKCELYESGYQFFTTNNISRSIRSQLFSDMNFEENWIDKECEDIQDTWKNMFIDLSKPLSDDMIKIAKKHYNDIYFSDIENSNNFWNQSADSLGNKSYIEKLQENVLNNIIPGYSFIYLDIGFFKADKLPVVIECLKRLYEVTGFRPISSLVVIASQQFRTLSAYEDVGTLYGADLKLYKVSDIEYKNLCNIFERISPNDKTTELTKHFL
jgi:hypothetical protein